MIRRLNEADRPSVDALLSSAPQLNLYMLGNLEKNGFDADFCEFFGDIVDGRLRGVINRYDSGWTVFGEADADWVGLGGVVDAHATVAERLQDNPGGVASFLPYLSGYTVASFAHDWLMELPLDGFLPQSAQDGFEVRKATMDDLPELVTFFADADEMSRTPAGVERPLRERSVWMALKEGKVVSAALTNAETKKLAMVGGGLYSALMARLRSLPGRVQRSLRGAFAEWTPASPLLG